MVTAELFKDDRVSVAYNGHPATLGTIVALDDYFALVRLDETGYEATFPCEDLKIVRH